MTIKILIPCIVIVVASVVLFFLAWFLKLGTLALSLGKLGMFTGGVSSLAIAISLCLFGKHRTDALLRNVLVLLTTVVFMLLTSEFCVRFIFKDITTTSDNVSYFARKWHKKNVQLNSWGFRDLEFELAKPEGVYRIAVIGDSFTFGQGIEEKDRVSNLLGSYLDSKGRYQVLNFGKPGAETIHELSLLRDLVLKTEPDFVILQWYINDFEGRNKGGRPKCLPLLPSYSLCYTFHRISALYYLLNRKWQSLQVAFGLRASYKDYMRQRFGDPTSPDSLEAVTTLTHFIDECKARDIGIGIVLFPDIVDDLEDSYPFFYLHERVVGLCHMKRTLCLDLRSTFARYPERKQLWANRFDSHPGALANEIAANRLIETFAPIWLSANTE